MYLLDTNVLSALMATSPDRTLTRWIASKPIAALFTSAVCEAEVLAGIGMLPSGRRRARLEEAARDVFGHAFAGRVLAFDSAAARVYASLFERRRRTGRGVATADLMIAATAQAADATVVSRDRDFADSGLTVINPWVG